MNKAGTDMKMKAARSRTIAAIFAAIIGACVVAGPHDAVAQQLFRTPEGAVEAFVAAVRSEKPEQIVSVIGRDGRQIAQSGDAVADAKVRTAFLVAYDQQHKLVADGSDKFILNIGNNDWPLPIPLVKRRGYWQFDSIVGREEVLARRIGRNELDAIQVCLAYVDAQNEYASINPEKSPDPAYAMRFNSRRGKKDGLFWAPEAGDAKSPLGDAMAKATQEGYRFGGSPIPYHGYYYKILTGQGATAPGGEMDYVVKGRMIGGFALVAYPAEYGNSGVMTFLVNHAGVVFQKDLGPRTSRIAGRISLFNPDRTWKRVPDTDLTAK